MLASKMSVIMSTLQTVSIITAISGGVVGVTALLTAAALALAGIPMVNVIALAVAVIAAIIVGVMVIVNAIMQIFHTERHLS